MNQTRHPLTSFGRLLLFLLMLVFCSTGFHSTVEASPRIKESRLDRSKEDLREPLFTEYMETHEVADFVANQKGFPLYQEVNRKGESRILLVEGVRRSHYYYYCLMSEESLIEKQEDLSKKGFTLITLSEDADGRFAATWVDSSKVQFFADKMAELGIGMATYED